MKDGTLKEEVGKTLCQACAAAQSQGHPSARLLARKALEVAREEMGSLPHQSECPMGHDAVEGCPLLQRKDD